MEATSTNPQSNSQSNRHVPELAPVYQIIGDGAVDGPSEYGYDHHDRDAHDRWAKHGHLACTTAGIIQRWIASPVLLLRQDESKVPVARWTASGRLRS